MDKKMILKRILWRIIQDRLAILGAKISSPIVMRTLFDIENDIYDLL